MGIWDLSLKYKESGFYLSKYDLREHFIVLQLSELMKNDKYFSLNMKSIGGIILTIIILLRP